MAYIYRALNNIDAEHINNGVYSSINIPNSSLDSKLHSKREDYRSIYVKNFGNCLDVVYGHILGSRIKDCTSPWISTTMDLNEAISEYAIIQNGNYNKIRNRKPIIVIEEDNLENKVIVNNMEIPFNNNIRNINPKQINECILVLNDDGIKKLTEQKKIADGNYDTPICDSEVYNDEFGRLRSFYYTLDGRRPDWNGINGYANKSSEVLIFNKINKDKIKYVLPPLIQDILFSGVISIDDLASCNYKENIKNAISKFDEVEKKIFIESYGVNYSSGIYLNDYCNLIFYDKTIIQIIMENYNTINNINNTYNSLKDIKRSFIKKIIEEICGFKFDIQYRIPDDTIYTAMLGNNILTFNDGTTTPGKKIYDLICIQKDNKVVDIVGNKEFIKMHK